MQIKAVKNARLATLPKEVSVLNAKIINIESSQFGTKIEFSDGFYTQVTVEKNDDGSVTIDDKMYKIGDKVKLTNYNEKEVYNFD